MRITRRNVLQGSALAAAGLMPPLAEGAPAERKREPDAHEAPHRDTKIRETPLPLPPWKYGGSSTSTETVLMFRGNPAHTFYGTGPIPDAPRMLWKYHMPDFPSINHGKPVVWQGTGWTGQASKLGNYIYVGSVSCILYCFEAKTGKVEWSLRGGRMFKSSVCVYDNKVYVGNVDDHIRCVDAATGKTLWKFNTTRDCDSSPCVVDGRLYIAGESGYARCLDPQTGKEIWKTFIDGIGPGTPPGSNGSETSPAIADGEYYCANYDGILFNIDTKDGRIRWKAKTGDDTDASPVVYGDFVYAAAEEKAPHLYCFTRREGREVWRYTDNKVAWYSTPAIVNDRIYIGGDDKNLHCVDAKTGKAIWKFKTGEPVWTSPCVVDDKVVFGSRDANLYILDAKTGQEIWRYKADGRFLSTPCIVDGTIWIGTASGWFYCFGP